MLLSDPRREGIPGDYGLQTGNERSENWPFVCIILGFGNKFSPVIITNLYTGTYKKKMGLAQVNCSSYDRFTTCGCDQWQRRSQCLNRLSLEVNYLNLCRAIQRV